MHHNSTWMRSSLAALLLASLSGGCGPGRTFASDGPSADATADARGNCTRNEDCNDNTACTRDLCLVGGVCENSPDNAMCPIGQSCVSGRGCTAGGTRTCMSAAECDDRIPCTRDTCLVDGTCRNQTDDTMCPMGQRCNATTGCGTSAGRCTMASECNDMIDCTEDTCTVAGTCEHVPQNTRCTGGRTCNAMMGCIMASSCRNAAECDDRIYCNGAETCNTELACVAGTAVNCADMDPCTVDTCNETMRTCTHTPDMACMGGTVRSGIYDISPAPAYMCGFGGVNFNVRFLQFTVTASGLTVTGAPVTMTGAAPMAGRFSATGTIPGTCPEVYTVTGTFSSMNEFSGELTVTFTGGGFCFDCLPQRFTIRGTYRM
jgi:hypothetical protein